jgi:hypothetical protein
MGDFEVLRTVFEYYLHMLPLAEARTQAYFQHDGIFFVETKTLFGTMAGDDYGCDHLSPGAIKRPIQLMDSSFMRFDYAGNAGPTEVCMLILDDYLWSLDVEAAKRYLPICFKTLEFFMNHYRVSTTGQASEGSEQVIFFPSQALESYQCAVRLVNNSWIDLTDHMNLTWNDGHWSGGLNESNCVLNDAPTVAAVTALTERLLALPTELTTQTQRSAWQAYAEMLPELPRSPDRSTFTVYENIEEFPLNASNSETPQLYSVFPFRLFTAARANASDIDLSAALKAATGGQPGYGQNSGWAQDLINDALLGRSLEASALAIDRAMHSGCRGQPTGALIFGWYRRCAPDQEQQWGYRFKGYGYQGAGLSAHPPAVEELSNMQTAINFMLMQPMDDGFEGGIAMFPAWPCDWDVDVKLAAPGNTTVEVHYTGGKLQKMVVQPPQRASAITFLNCV